MSTSEHDTGENGIEGALALGITAFVLVLAVMEWLTEDDDETETSEDVVSYRAQRMRELEHEIENGGLR